MRLYLGAVLILFLVGMNLEFSHAAPTIVPCTGTGTANIACGFISVTNTTIDIGQNTIITVNGITGGQPGVNGYTANWILDGVSISQQYNTIQSNTIALLYESLTSTSANALFYNGIVNPANFISSNIVTTTTPNTLTFNAVIDDLPASNTLTTNDIPTVTTNTALTAPSAPTVSNTLLDVNQVETVSGTIPSTGTTPYTWNWMISVNGGTYAQTTQCATNSGTGAAASAPETCSIAGSTLTAGDNYAFELKVTDSATTPETQTSAASPTVPVSSVLGTPTTPVITANTFDYLQTNTFTISTTVSGGTSPYTYNFIAYYASNDTAYDNEHFTASSNTAADGFSSSAAPGNYVYGVTVTDSATTNEVTNSPYTTNLLIASDPAITLTPSNTPIDAGQIETYTFTVSNGIGPFTIELYNVTGSKQQGSNVIIQSPGGSNAISFQTSNTGTFSYNALVTDLGTSAPYAFNSATNTIVINTALTAPSTPTVYAAKTEINQNDAVYSYLPATGTAPYSYLFLVSANGGSYAAATQCSIDSGSSQAANAQEACILSGSPSSLTPGNYIFKLQATDSASTPETTNSAASPTITAKTPPSIMTFTPSFPLIDAGQTETYTASVSNGFGPFTVELFNITGSAAVGSNVIITSPGGSNTLSFNAAGGGTFQYNAIATDLGTTNPYVFNSASNTLTVANAPVISIKTNKISLNAGGSVIFTANIPSGEGIGPFAVNLVVGGSTIANTVIPSNGGSFTYTYTFNSQGVYTSEFQAVDKGTTVPFAFDSNSVTISVGLATGGGGGTGGSGGGGGGGPQAPSIQNTSNGYNVTGVAQLNTFTLNLCGKRFQVTDNFITPNYTGVSIGTSPYDLYVDKPQLLAGTASCYAKVTSISYLPILVTVNFLFYNTQLNATNTIDIVGNPVHAEVNLTNSSVLTLDVNNGNLLLSLLASISARDNITVENLTSLPVPAPANFRVARVIAINVTSSSTPKPSTHIHIIEKYNCTIPSSRIMPYLLLNGSWQGITSYSTNSSACTISYSITEDPILALFELITPISTTTIPSTSVATTSIATTSIPYSKPTPATDYDVALIIIVLILLVAAYELYRRRKGDIPRLKT